MRWGKLTRFFTRRRSTTRRSLDEREMMRANMDASMALFEYVATHGCKNIVYASSTAVYGATPAPYVEDNGLEPLNPYGVSKLMLDQKATAFAAAHPEIKVVGLRYCNVYGPRESHKGARASMIYQLAQQMKKGNPRIFKAGEQKRDYIYVKDVVRANMLALEAKESCIVNCGSGTATTFNDLSRSLIGDGLTAHAGIYRQPLRRPVSELHSVRHDARKRKARICAGVYARDGHQGLLRKRVPCFIAPCHPLTPSCSSAPTETGRSTAMKIIILIEPPLEGTT